MIMLNQEQLLPKPTIVLCSAEIRSANVLLEDWIDDDV